MKPFDEPIYVSRPHLPPLGEYAKGLEEIWRNRWLTNHGPVLRRFEQKLAAYLRTDNFSLMCNGSLAFELGLQGLGLAGEVITTPFTFSATIHGLARNGLRPVFCDIEEQYFCLSPEKAEALITPETSAILAVHVFGYPCQLDALDALAERHRLKLIYDAAHAFGVEVAGTPIAHFGDLSMFSLHATKPFHAIEGGCIVFRDPTLRAFYDKAKDNGYESESEVGMVGTNAKMNEFQALMGELVLARLEWIIARRAEAEATYRAGLADIPGLRFAPPLPETVRHNHSFLPVLVEQGEFGMHRDGLIDALRTYNVFPRKYFHPLMSQVSCYAHLERRAPLTVAERVADSVMCLPLYAELEVGQVERICAIIRKIRDV